MEHFLSCTNVNIAACQWPAEQARGTKIGADEVGAKSEDRLLLASLPDINFHSSTSCQLLPRTIRHTCSEKPIALETTLLESVVLISNEMNRDSMSKTLCLTSTRQPRITCTDHSGSEDE